MKRYMAEVFGTFRLVFGALTLIPPVGIPVTSTSVNPARSTGVALFAGGSCLGQLRFFLAGPAVRRFSGRIRVPFVFRRETGV